MQPSRIVVEALETTRRVAILVLVPFVVAVLRWRDIVATGAETSTAFSVTFPTPHSMITLWSFVNAATESGAGVSAGTLPALVGVGFGMLFVATIVVYVVITGLVLAGYLGSIDAAIATGSYDVEDNVRRYGWPLVAYEALSILTLLALVGAMMVIPALFPVVAIGVFVIAYLTYLTPYLVVVTDVGLVSALVRSIGLTTHRSEPIIAYLTFVVVGAVLSIPLSMVAYGNGIVGGLIAAALAAPIGLFASVVFVTFTRKVVDVARGRPLVRGASSDE